MKYSIPVLRGKTDTERLEELVRYMQILVRDLQYDSDDKDKRIESLSAKSDTEDQSKSILQSRGI